MPRSSSSPSFATAPPTVVIVKHANPCGVATGETLVEAYEAALACDSVSAFGGIIAVNRPLDGPTAEAISGIFTEVVVAPAADDAAKAVFARKKNLRLLLTGPLPDAGRPGIAFQSIAGGVLFQSRDNGAVSQADLKVGDQAPADARGACRLPVRLDGGQARQVQRDRLRQGRFDRRRRRGADEPARERADRGVEGQGRRREGGLGRTPHDWFGGCLGRLLPLRRRPARGGRGGGDRGDPAGWLDPRRRRHRGRRRGGAGDAVHRNAALPALRRNIPLPA